MLNVRIFEHTVKLNFESCLIFINSISDLKTNHNMILPQLDQQNLTVMISVIDERKLKTDYKQIALSSSNYAS